MATEILQKHALVSKQVMEDNKPICWAFREIPEAKNDSGWRFFSGEETEEFFETEEDIMEVELNSILDKISSLMDFLKEQPGIELERDDETQSWEKVIPL